jgi:hypothetical protein
MYSEATLVMRKYCNRSEFSKSGNGWKYPFWCPLIPKKCFLAHGLYGCTYYRFKWEKVVYKISQERFVLERWNLLCYPGMVQWRDCNNLVKIGVSLIQISTKVNVASYFGKKANFLILYMIPYYTGSILR